MILPLDSAFLRYQGTEKRNEEKKKKNEKQLTLETEAVLCKVFLHTLQIGERF